MQRHGQTLEGLLAQSEKQHLTQLHRNAQRLLRPLKVVNPYAHQLTFLSDKTRTRRDHMKYLTLIQAVALLHQYQREVKRATHRGQVIEYIEVTKGDIRLATTLAHEVLGRTLDEMPPQTRKLLVLLKTEVHVQAQRQGMKPDELRFTRRDVRQWLQWGDTQLKIHLGRLLELEYLQLNRRGLMHEYSLLWDGEDNGNAHLCGLPDTENLTITPPAPEGDTLRSGSEALWSAPGREVVTPQSDSKKTAPEQVAQGPTPQPGGLNADAVNSSKTKTPLHATPRPHPDSAHAAAVTHG